MPLPFVICLLGFTGFQAGAFLVYAIWIPRFVEAHGGQAAGFSAHLVLGSGWLRDYREAHAIRRRIGRTPWFLRTFEILQAVAVLFFIGGFACAALTP